MEQFYLEQTQFLEDTMTKVRSLTKLGNDMKETCYELNMAMAALHNPEIMNRFWEAEAVMKETLAHVKVVLDEEHHSIPVIKIECSQSDNVGTTGDLDNTDVHGVITAVRIDKQQGN